MAVLTVIFGFVTALFGLLWCIDVFTPGSRSIQDFRFYIASLGAGLVAVLIGGCAWIFVDMIEKFDAIILAGEMARLAKDTRKPGDPF